MAYPIYRTFRDSDRDTFYNDMFQWKEDMVTTGWRILGSGDGSAFSNTGQGAGTGTGSGGSFDHITVATDLDCSSNGGNHAWIRFATPSAAAHHY